MEIPRSHPNWARLVDGTFAHDFKVIPASLMVSRLMRQYKSERTPQKLEESIAEMVDFFNKYQEILVDDLNIILK